MLRASCFIVSFLLCCFSCIIAILGLGGIVYEDTALEEAYAHVTHVIAPDVRKSEKIFVATVKGTW